METSRAPAGRKENQLKKWLSMKRRPGWDAAPLLTEGRLRAQPPVLLPVGAGLQEGAIPTNFPAWGNVAFLMAANG